MTATAWNTVSGKCAVDGGHGSKNARKTDPWSVTFAAQKATWLAVP